MTSGEFWNEYELIKNEVLNSATQEGKGCVIVPKCIFLTEKLAMGRNRQSWVKSGSNYKTPEWVVVEEL